MAQVATRGSGNSKCLNHAGCDVIYICADCDGSLACVECVTSVHQRHGLTKLSDVIPSKIKKLEIFMEKIEEVELPQLQRDVGNAEERLKLDAEVVAKQIRAIEHRNEEFKAKSDELTKELIETCKQFEVQNSNLLDNYKKQLEKMLMGLKKELETCKDLVQNGSHVQVYDKRIVSLQDLINYPDVPTRNTVKFNPSHVTDGEFAENFGFLTLSCSQTTDLESRTESVKYCPPASDPTEHISETAPETSSCQEMVSFLQTLDITSLCAVPGGPAWACHRDKTTILKLHSNGEVLCTLDMEDVVHDVTWAFKNKRLWFCCRDHSIREVMADSAISAKTRFFTENIPRCICVTRGNTVVVGVKGKVIIFTTKGKVLFKSGTGKSVIVSPHRLSECPVTGNLAILDRDCKRDDGEGRPNIVITNAQLNTLVKYRGQGTPVEPRLFSTLFKMSAFDPCGICFDNQGYLLIADYANQSLYLMTGMGQFLKTVLLVEDEFPLAVGIHSESTIVAVFDRKSGPEKQVRILKYSH